MRVWFLIAAILGVAGIAAAQGLPILGAYVVGTPTSATPVQAVAIIDPCDWIGPSQVSIVGNVVTWVIDLRGLPCGTPPPSPGAFATFGPLSPGQYTLVVRSRDPLTGELGPPFTVSFGVIAAPESVPSMGALGIAMLAMMLVAAALLRRGSA